jgi:hypothetical protein
MFCQPIGFVCRLLLVIAFALAPIAAFAAVGQWDTPALDRWFHQGDTAPGLKTDMSTFAFLGPGTPDSQARSGSFVLGFDTSDQIELVEADRYQINSISVQLDYVDETRNVPYDPTHDTIQSIVGGTDQDAGKPIELFGAGHANGYERLGFGANNAMPPEFEEATSLISSGSFNIFPLGDDGAGNLGNIFNSPGGEGTTPGWDVTPWAVGTAPLTPGAIISPLTTFTFNVNLALPGIREYFQDGLSIGQLAVFISSLHSAVGHSGGPGEDFPAFHSKESLWVEFGLAEAPRLEIDYTILPESTIPGDFDDDGDVDADDLADWQTSYGIDGAADADDDGDSDGRDFLIWQRNYTGPGSIAAFSVPEPTSLLVVIFGIIMGLPTRAFFPRAF